jgi:NOL1/NOP2/fmu family ribosome biogenesis protein
MRKEFRVESLELNIDKEWNIVESAGGYRFWPDKVKGEGFFIAVMLRTDGNKGSAKTQGQVSAVSRSERQIIEKWMKPEGFEFIKNKNDVYAWPASLRKDMGFILENLRVMYSGVKIGELVRDKLVPDHALAMSGCVIDNIPRVELDYDAAIRYLRKESIETIRKTTGWHLVTFQQHSLGWINILPNRINNYYPKELRILKER